MTKIHFEWDSGKDKLNQKKHNVSFIVAQYVFFDKNRIIAEDIKHSNKEKRYYCIGKKDDEILTVCFTWRGAIVRIISAGYWRKGKVTYEKKNKIH